MFKIPVVGPTLVVSNPMAPFTLCSATNENGGNLTGGASNHAIPATARFVLKEAGSLTRQFVPGIPQLPNSLSKKFYREPPRFKQFMKQPKDLNKSDRALLATALAAFDNAIESISLEEAQKLDKDFKAVMLSLREIQQLAETIDIDVERFNRLLFSLKSYRQRIQCCIQRKESLVDPESSLFRGYHYYYLIPWFGAEISYGEMNQLLQEFARKMELPETMEYFELCAKRDRASRQKSSALQLKIMKHLPKLRAAWLKATMSSRT